MSRIIGCRDLHFAKLEATVGANGLPEYGTPEAIPSLINIAVKDSVQSTSFYSDDVVEQNFSKTASKEVSIELGYLEPELEGKLTGKSFVNGMLVQTADDAAPEVALMFRAPKSRAGAFRYMVFYKGTLSRTDSDYKTQEDKVEGATVKLTGQFISTSFGMIASSADTDSKTPSAAIATWFTKVAMPSSPSEVKKK